MNIFKHIKANYTILGVVFIILYSLNLQAQLSPLLREKLNEVSGLPFIKNYTPEDYLAFDQNWASTQDSLGIMYFANGDGVLLYDGVNWQLIPLPNNGMVRGVVLGPKQVIYVCGTNEVGYLHADSIGQIGYQSLLDKESDDEVGVVYEAIATKDKVYFRTKHKLITWHNQNLEYQEFKAQITCMDIVDDMVFLALHKEGVFRIDENKITKYIEIDQENLIIRFITKYGNDKLLLGSQNNGLFIFDGLRLNKFETQDDEYFSTKSIRDGILMRDSIYAIGTLGGIVFIDGDGNTCLQVNRKDLITSQKIYHLFKDQNELLWAAMDFGIAKIEYPSRFSTIDARAGLQGVVMNIKRHNNEIYIATEYGLSKLKKDRNNIPKVESIYEINNFVYDLLSINNSLFFTTDEGLFIYRDEKIEKISASDFNSFCQSSIDSNRVFVSFNEGIRSIYFENNTWKLEGVISKLLGPTYGIREMDNGDLWSETDINQINKISFENPKTLKAPMVKSLSIDEGLPDAIGRIFKLNDELYYRVIYGQDVYKLDRPSQSFHLDTSISSMLHLKGKIVKVRKVDDQNNLWFDLFDNNDHPGFRMVAWKQSDGKYKVQNLEEERIYNLGGKLQYPEARKQVVWYLGKKNIFRHDLSIRPTPPKPFSALIRSVIYQNDSILFAGYSNEDKSNISNSVLAYKNNSFRFEFGCPSYFDEKVNSYQYYLEGYESQWSEFTSETIKEYTNLSEGAYTFHLRARNILNQLSNQDSYLFTIAPPWYRSLWAFFLYLIGAISGIYYLVEWRSKRLIQEKDKLENTISIRTEELQKSNDKLQSQKQQLAIQTEELKVVDQMKSRLFANISHEFRTPLTLIKGPLDRLVRFPKSSLDSANVEMMHRNSDRLLRLVNQMLDLSKLDSGNLPLNLTEGSLLQCIRTAASSFSSMAADRNLDYRINIPAHRLWANFDRDKLEKIVYNLLSNAFKFTDDEGSITIESYYENSELNLNVSDTGRGIPSTDQSKIFDRFYQIDDSHTKTTEGTGIGLALVKELVLLLNGTIHFESTLGQGTTFYMSLPISEIKGGSNGYTERKLENLTKKIPVVNPGNQPSDGMLAPKSTILLVEDNEDMRAYVASQLEKEFSIVQAINGGNGLAKAFEEVPDLIITDLMMPDMDGLELCKLLKSDHRSSHIPIIMLTAKAGIENKLEGLETGADSYLTKPFDSRELEVSVKNLILQRKKLRELFSRREFLNPKDLEWSSIDQQFLEKLLEVLETEHDQAAYGVTELQSSMNLSKAQLHRKLKALTDQAPGEFIRNFRLKRAAQILSKNGNTVTQTAYAVGFNNLSYFAKCFKELYGLKPSEYMASHSQE